RHQRCHRGHVQDHSTTCTLHVTDGGFGAMKYTLYIHLKQAIQVGFFYLLDIADVRYTCIVDQNVQPDLTGNLCKKCLNLRPVGHIAQAKICPEALLSQFMLECRSLCLIHVQYLYMCPLPSKQGGNTSAYAAGSTRDNRRFSCQIKYFHFTFSLTK